MPFLSESPERPLPLFRRPDSKNTTTLLLSDDGFTLFVGAQDAVLSLDVSKPDVITMKTKVGTFERKRELSYFIRDKFIKGSYSLTNILSVCFSYRWIGSPLQMFFTCVPLRARKKRYSLSHLALQCMHLPSQETMRTTLTSLISAYVLIFLRRTVPTLCECCNPSMPPTCMPVEHLHTTLMIPIW